MLQLEPGAEALATGHFFWFSYHFLGFRQMFLVFISFFFGFSPDFVGFLSEFFRCMCVYIYICVNMCIYMYIIGCFRLVLELGPCVLLVVYYVYLHALELTLMC